MAGSPASTGSTGDAGNPYDAPHGDGAVARPERVGYGAAARVIAVSAASFAVTGMSAGWVIGTFLPGAIVIAPQAPVEFAVGAGLANGLVAGIVVGVILFVCVTWYEVRRLPR